MKVGEDDRGSEKFTDPHDEKLARMDLPYPTQPTYPLATASSESVPNTCGVYTYTVCIYTKVEHYRGLSLP